MKILILIFLFIQTYLIANIDINKKAVTVAISSNLSKSIQIANDLDSYDVYIYKTSTTQTSYYVIYVVNISKDNEKFALLDIKKFFNDSYISSDSRVEKLATNNFEKNVFIKAFTKYKAKTIITEPLVKEDIKIVVLDEKLKVPDEINSTKSIKVVKEINIHKEEDIFTIQQYIKKDKRILFIGYANKKKISNFVKRYNFHDMFIKNNTEDEINNNLAVYLVNIEDENFDFLLKYMRKYYPSTKEILRSKLISNNLKINYIKYIAKKDRKPIYQTNGCN